jgi:hypothetical protein
MTAAEEVVAMFTLSVTAVTYLAVGTTSTNLAAAIAATPLADNHEVHK